MVAIERRCSFCLNEWLQNRPAERRLSTAYSHAWHSRGKMEPDDQKAAKVRVGAGRPGQHKLQMPFVAVGVSTTPTSATPLHGPNTHRCQIVKHLLERPWNTGRMQQRSRPLQAATPALCAWLVRKLRRGSTRLFAGALRNAGRVLSSVRHGMHVPREVGV